MNRSEIKSYKERLRQIEDHLRHAHDTMGVQRDSIGFVEVVHHPTYVLPELNYVTPRRKTALVPGKHVEDGISSLRDHRRSARMLYVEELFPPFFGDSLQKIGLSLEDRYPLWTIDLTQSITPQSLPDELSVKTVINQQGIEIWSLIWRNANYQVHGTPLEPIQVGKQYIHQNTVVDVILYNHDTPIAVARLTIHESTAHLMARALHQPIQLPNLHQCLIQVATQTAIEHDCTLLFICDKNIEQLLSSSDLPCQQDGNMLCYTDSIDDSFGEETHDTVEQPLLLT
jgi:hypothetical protein